MPCEKAKGSELRSDLGVGVAELRPREEWGLRELPGPTRSCKCKCVCWAESQGYLAHVLWTELCDTRQSQKRQGCGLAGNRDPSEEVTRGLLPVAHSQVHEGRHGGGEETSGQVGSAGRASWER